MISATVASWPCWPGCGELTRARWTASRLARTPAMRWEPRTSTRRSSRLSYTRPATSPVGAKRRWTPSSWCRTRRAARSASPRTRPSSCAMRSGRGRLSRTASGEIWARSRRFSRPRKATSSAGRSAMARTTAPSARCSSSRFSRSASDKAGLPLESSVGEVGRRLRQLLAEAALVVLGHGVPLRLVALVEEGEAEAEAQVAEDLGVLGPGDDRAGRHDGRDVAGDEAVAGQLGQGHHRRDLLAAVGRVVARALGQDDPDLVLVTQVVELGDDRPAVHLALVDLLRAVVEARGVAEAHRVRGREQAERAVRADHLVLVEQRHPALRLEDALDDEHDVGPAGIVLVEDERHRALQRPGQDALAVLGDLLAVPENDRVLADEVDAADVAVEVDPHAGPVEAGRDLLDVRRFAGTVIALDQHAAVVGEARQDRHRRVAVELVGRIDVGHVLGPPAEGADRDLGVEAERLTDADAEVRILRQFQEVRGPDLRTVEKHLEISSQLQGRAGLLCDPDAGVGKTA